MRTVLNWLRTSGLAAAVLAGSMATNAMAAVIITVQQSGSNVVASLSGSINNLSGFSSNPQGPGATMFTIGNNQLNLYGSGNVNNAFLTQTSGPSNSWFGNMRLFSFASMNFNGTSDIGLRYGSYNVLFLAANYVAGTPLSGSATWSNETLSFANPNYGDYVYTLNTSGETVTFRLLDPNGGGSGAVPEPTSMAIFGLGALGFAYRNRRKLMK